MLADLKACRNHLCKHKGIPYDTDGCFRPKCEECGARLKPFRNASSYTGVVMTYTPSEGQKQLPGMLSPLTSRSPEAEQLEAQIVNDARKNHVIFYDTQISKWSCKCELKFDSDIEKEIHLDKMIPGRRSHYTYRDTINGGWSCWCGYKTDHIDDAGRHDSPKQDTGANNTKSCGAITKVNDTWSVESNLIQGCPIAPVPKLYVPMTFYSYWKWLAMAFNTEWLAYLKGEYRKEGDMVGWHVTDMYFPRQQVTGSHVNVLNEREDIQDGTIGDVHSHVRMNAFFSEEDKKHWNHDVHLVINAEGAVDSAIRTILGCGGQSRIKAQILYIADASLETHIADLKAKLMNPTGSHGAHK